MSIIRLFIAAVFAFTLLASSVFAADQPAPCCLEAKKAGKECTHECCVQARKDKKAVCEKCGGKKDTEKK